MLKQIAQELAESVSRAIDCEVAIFDRDSIIVGASDLSRLGRFNQGSVEVIRTGKPLLHKPGYIEHMENTKPGHCFPLLLSGEVIGAVGIVGVKDEVKRYAQLVQSLSEIVMKEAMNQMTRISADYAHQELVRNIVNLEPTSMNQEILLRKGFEIGVDLRYAHIPVAVDLLNLPQTSEVRENGEESADLVRRLKNGNLLRRIDQIFSDVNDLCASTAGDKILILYAFGSSAEEENALARVKEKCLRLRELFLEDGIEIMCGVGAVAGRLAELRDSCRSAWLVLSTAARLKKADSKMLQDQWIFCMQDFFIETVMADSRDNCMDWYQKRHLCRIFRQPDAAELIRTIRCWCESGFKYTKASEMLFIHRNTLMYRLKKIENICRVSSEEPREMIALHLAILRAILAAPPGRDPQNREKPAENG